MGCDRLGARAGAGVESERAAKPPDADVVLLEVGAVMGACERGMTELEAALEHAAATGRS